MSTQETISTAQLPGYIADAKPNPPGNRAPWYKNTAPTYAGIFLWFVFWQQAVSAANPGGGLAAGVGMALIGLVLAALICHFLFYLAPGLLGMKTGLPLYIVGTSTFGATGGFILPGFLMGALQFGWLGVNTFFSSLAISQIISDPSQQLMAARVIMVIWGILAAFVGLKGIKYVAPVATYLPLIPLTILVIMFAKTVGGVGHFNPQTLINAQKTAGSAPLNAIGVLAFMLTYVVGFFATAGAAGVDFGMNNRDDRDVQMGGLVGIALAILVTAGLSTLIVAGVHGTPDLSAAAIEAGKKAVAKDPTLGNISLNSVFLIPIVFGEKIGRWLPSLLALAAFPSACFSSFIAANSFKTTLPKVNPFISVGIGAAVSIGLALSGLAGDAQGVFGIIGASFGPICGAMMVDYLLAGNRWSGPRAGFNPAGWISWALGFLVGIMPNLHGWNPSIPNVPAAPVAAFIVGAVVYFLCAKAGLLTPILPMPARVDAQPSPATV